MRRVRRSEGGRGKRRSSEGVGRGVRGAGGKGGGVRGVGRGVRGVGRGVRGAGGKGGVVRGVRRGVRGAGGKGGAVRGQGGFVGGTKGAGSLHDGPVNQLGRQGEPGGRAHTSQCLWVHEGRVVVATVGERGPQASKVGEVVPAEVLLDEVEEGGEEGVGSSAVCSG